MDAKKLVEELERICKENEDEPDMMGLVCMIRGAIHRYENDKTVEPAPFQRGANKIWLENKALREEIERLKKKQIEIKNEEYKPPTDLQGQHKAMINLAQDNGLNLAADWAVNMSGKTFTENDKAGEVIPPLHHLAPSLSPAPVERDGLISKNEVLTLIHEDSYWANKKLEKKVKALPETVAHFDSIADAAQFAAALDKRCSICKTGSDNSMMRQELIKLAGEITPISFGGKRILDILSRHPSTSLSTEELIAELEKRIPCKKCDYENPTWEDDDKCGMKSCIWKTLKINNFKPIDVDKDKDKK